MQIKTLLVANRGEIARRIAKGARAADIRPVAIHSDADASAAHVRDIGQSIWVGGGPASESYLKIDAVLDAARRAGADAIHPGYGFLAENPDFARAVEAAGMAFVGPTAETLEKFGDKASAKAAAIAAGVPVIPGDEGALSDPDKIAKAVLAMGLPVLLKAVGGGGGRGQRLVESEATLVEDIEGALREAKSTFGSEGMLLERFLPDARHVEIQIAGDGQGNVVHLFERDCTLQRRHQKVIEEAPAWGLPRDLLDRIAADAVRLGQTLNYRSLGTVEFLVVGDEYFFLEVNPRIQVEHPVTEAVTGLDLVALQLRIAQGQGLGLTQDDITCTGHAVEARLYAEDPANQFAPSTGLITDLSLPGGLRIDSGVETGDSVSPFYDPMIAKLIVHGPDRETALARLADALEHTTVTGVDTNRDFLLALTRDDSFATMQVHTRWIDAHLDALTATPTLPHAALWRAVAAVLFVMDGREDGVANPWKNRDSFSGWRLGLGGDLLEAGQRVALSLAGDDEVELRVGPVKTGGAFTVYDEADNALTLTCTEIAPQRWQLTHAGEVLVIQAQVSAGGIGLDTPDGRLAFHAVPPLAHAGEDGVAERQVIAPLTGAIVAVKVANGDRVAEGDVVAIMESMKLELSIRSGADGLASGISIKQGQMVDRGQVIAEIIEEEQT
ncbi:MAG: ATP-grasp domain-containing protein [Rhodobacteraceae bacterium]|nr:ATP-grasp domain-containing protein [Paracoccaceae bacterium]